MSTNLIKLLVNIEEHASSSKPTKSHHPLFKKTFNFSKPIQNSPQLHPKLKEKHQRRALRSKISKILQSLPHHCEKEAQKNFSIRWFNQKKKFYEINKSRKLKGQDPITKLNLSSESESCETGITAREALMNYLNEDELVLVSEDPGYFIPDKKLLKVNVENDWDELLRKDQNEEGKIQEKKDLIDFLDVPKMNKREKKERVFKKKVIITVNSAKNLASTKPSTKNLSFRPENKKVLIKNTESSLPVLKKIVKKTEIKTSPSKDSFNEKESKTIENFLKASKVYEKSLKILIIQSAKEEKLMKVKSLLNKWEQKKRVSF